jgi:D-beta-D-heptose 7-phosphate kinase/D-beta-D-heptose 1-phosphate adenosyltransferase
MIDLIEILTEKIRNGLVKPIVCVGDIMLDRFYYGHVSRISPEAPVPVLLIQDEKLMLGGAGNVVANISKLDVATKFLSVLGDDNDGAMLRDMLNELAGCNPVILSEHNRLTTVKTRCVGSNQQIVRLDKESTSEISIESQRYLILSILDSLKIGGVLILSDYGKGVLSNTVITEAVKAANASDMKVVVDPKGNNYEKYRDVFLITPNRKELAEATGFTVNSDETITYAARVLIERYGIKNVLVTRSEEGMTLVPNEGDVCHIRTTARDVYDVTGAGDTVLATLSVALCCGVSLYEASLLANQAASVVVGKAGTAAININELHDSILKNEAISAEKKLFSSTQIRRLVSEWKLSGFCVGFTNGCYDLLHPGHVTLLEKCRAKCDKLVVAINTDKSVKRLKGDSRPVQSEISRAIIIASLQSVDAVVLFSEDTPLALIQDLCPDKLFKGGDYSLQSIVGAEIVNNTGGEVVIIDLVPDQSTTRLINRMNNSVE